MKLSNSSLVLEFWEYVLSSNWAKGPGCPHCSQALCKIPLFYKAEQHPVLACQTCYHLILRSETLPYFEGEKLESKTKTNRFQKNSIKDPIDEFVNSVADSGVQVLWKAAQTKLTFKLCAETYKEYAFTVSVWGLVSAVTCLLILKRIQGAFHWELIAAALAFAAGLSFSRPSMKLADTLRAHPKKQTRDIGPQSNGLSKFNRANPQTYTRAH